MKINKIVFILLLVVVVYGTVLMSGHWKTINKEETISYSKSDIPNDYLSVLNIDSSKMNYIKTTNVTSNPIISSFSYEKDIAVIVTKLRINTDTPMHKIVQTKSDLTSMEINVNEYSSLENYLMHFNYVNDYSLFDVKSIDIHFSRSNKPKELIVDDSICAYFINKCHGFKMNFNNKKDDVITTEMQVENIFEGGNQFRYNSPNIIVLLKRKKNFIYLYVFSKFDGLSKEIDESFIYKYLKLKK